MIASIVAICTGSILCASFCASVLPPWSLILGSVLFYGGGFAACSIWGNHCEHVKELEERINKLEKNKEATNYERD